MTEPTDHRKTAEDFLAEAPRPVNRDQSTLYALIGIGHALLAGEGSKRGRHTFAGEPIELTQNQAHALDLLIRDRNHPYGE